MSAGLSCGTNMMRMILFLFNFCFWVRLCTRRFLGDAWHLMCTVIYTSVYYDTILCAVVFYFNAMLTSVWCDGILHVPYMYTVIVIQHNTRSTIHYGYSIQQYAIQGLDDGCRAHTPLNGELAFAWI